MAQMLVKHLPDKFDGTSAGAGGGGGTERSVLVLCSVAGLDLKQSTIEAVPVVLGDRSKCFLLLMCEFKACSPIFPRSIILQQSRQLTQCLLPLNSLIQFLYLGSLSHFLLKTHFPMFDTECSLKIT